MIVDTDVLIWVLRGNPKAAKAVDRARDRAISVVSYMELLQGARDKPEVKAIKAFLVDVRFRVLPLTENIGHRASIYVEEYGLSAGVRMADALVAGTAVEAHEPLLTANDRHYRAIQDLDLKSFRP
ncbi:MAG TPA: type II toxin-antitoxin system VapC family toxin [Phycisphaerae bacterium]|nr:type II toxin-antitoxin system VapC family toxin [Phycisphaerae bacterium]